MKDEKRCAYVHPDGRQCRGAHTKDSRFCFAHDPTKVQERKEAAVQGGKARWAGERPAPAPPLASAYAALVEEGKEVHITCTQDLKDLMDRVLTLSMNGVLNAQMTNSVTNAIRVAAKLFEVEVLEARIAELERELGKEG